MNVLFIAGAILIGLGIFEEFVEDKKKPGTPPTTPPGNAPTTPPIEVAARPPEK